MLFKTDSETIQIQLLAQTKGDAEEELQLRLEPVPLLLSKDK
jgi:hypothetical protein